MKKLTYINPLVLVADAARAQVYTLEAETGRLVERVTLVNGAAQLNNQQLVSDREGRGHDRMGMGRHAMDPRTPAKTHAMEQFAQDVTNQVQKSLADFDLRNLVLIAAPRFLGQLRKALSPELKAKTYMEIDSDLTTHAPDDIANAITRQLAKE